MKMATFMTRIGHACLLVGMAAPLWAITGCGVEQAPSYTENLQRLKSPASEDATKESGKEVLHPDDAEGAKSDSEVAANSEDNQTGVGGTKTDSTRAGTGGSPGGQGMPTGSTENSGNGGAGGAGGMSGPGGTSGTGGAEQVAKILDA